jgi:hypothetical protein
VFALLVFFSLGQPACTATIHRIGAPNTEAEIVGSDADGLSVLDDSGTTHRLPRATVGEIDYPGNVLALIGAGLVGGGGVLLVTPSGGNEVPKSHLAAGSALSAIGFALLLGGVIPYYRSHSAAAALRLSRPGGAGLTFPLPDGAPRGPLGLGAGAAADDAPPALPIPTCAPVACTPVACTPVPWTPIPRVAVPCTPSTPAAPAPAASPAATPEAPGVATPATPAGEKPTAPRKKEPTTPASSATLDKVAPDAAAPPKPKIIFKPAPPAPPLPAGRSP